MAQTQRLYDFQPGQKALSAQVDGELDNLVTAHNTLDNEVTKKTGNHQGTWQGFSPGQVAEAVNGGRLDLLEKIIVDATRLGVIGDGTDQSTNMQNAINTLVALGGGKLIFPSGTFVFNNVTIPAGVYITIEGLNARKTIFKNTTGQLLIVGGVTNTDYFKLTDVRIESTNNNDYDKPLIDLKFVRNVTIENITSSLTGTGTLFRFDSSYLISVRDCMLRNGRYAVGFDLTNITSANEQQDTYKFDNVIVFGNLGVVLRRTGGNYHTIRFDGLKVLNLAADGDFGRYNESTLTVQGEVGNTAVTVATGVNFLVNDPVVIGYGEFVELNKVTAINGNVLTLAKPLRFVQTTDKRVITSGVAVALANPFNALFYGCHWEGMPVGIMVDSPRGLETFGNYCGSGEFLRICGGLQDAQIGMTTMNGSGGRNIIVKVPSENVSTIARLELNGKFPIPSGSPALVPTEGLSANTAYNINTLNTGVYEETVNLASGTSALRNLLKIVENGVEKFRKTFDGQFTWRNDVTLKYLTSKTIGMDTGGHFKVDGTWDGGHFIMGSYHLWVDATGDLRMKNGAPTSDLDGTIVGTQV